MKNEDALRSIRLFWYRVKHDFLTVPTLLAFFLSGIYILNKLSVTADYCVQTNMRATLAGYAFMTNNSFIQLVLMAACFLFFYPCPFRDQMYENIVVRTRTNAFVAGNLLYILFVSFVYVAFTLLMYALAMVRVLDISLNYGQAFTIMTRNQINIGFQLSSEILTNMKGTEAFSYALILEMATVLFFGLCIYAGNSISKKPIGIYMACIFLLLDIFVFNSMPDSWRVFAPVSLSMLSFYFGASKMNYIHPILFYSISYIIFILVVWLTENHILKGGEKNV